MISTGYAAVSEVFYPYRLSVRTLISFILVIRSFVTNTILAFTIICELVSSKGTCMSTETRIKLPFGRDFLEIDLPGQARPTVIRKSAQPGLPDPAAAVRFALDNPVNSESLKSLAQGRRSACILICDITRPVPNSLFLRPMITDLMEAGIPASEICVLVATGLHRPNEGEELAELVGDPWVLETVRVENHFARNEEDHVDLGVTPTRGLPVKIDRRLVDADLKIATGLVEPHFMAGYSGGRKVIIPGVAFADTIRTFHSAKFLEDPEAKSCNLEGNPLHEEQMQVLKMIGEAYSLNTVLNEDRELVHVTFGEIIASHEAAVKFTRSACVINVGRRFNTVVTSSAGYPLDSSYYQTVKGMVTPLDILKPGGTLIVVSKCSEGLGSDEYRTAQKALTELGPDAFLQSLIVKKLAAIDEWQTEMQLRATRLVQVQLYAPGLNAEDRAITGVHMIDSVEDAIKASIERTGDLDVAIIPEGPYVIPVCELA
jgi:nickel-dependent lactate racemase